MPVLFLVLQKDFRGNEGRSDTEERSLDRRIPSSRPVLP